MNEKIWSMKRWFIKKIFWSQRCAARSVEITLYLNILAKSKFENTRACLSGAQMGLIHEKNGGRKSHDTLPLKIMRHGIFLALIV